MKKEIYNPMENIFDTFKNLEKYDVDTLKNNINIELKRKRNIHTIKNEVNSAYVNIYFDLDKKSFLARSVNKFLDNVEVFPNNYLYICNTSQYVDDLSFINKGILELAYSWGDNFNLQNLDDVCFHTGLIRTNVVNKINLDFKKVNIIVNEYLCNVMHKYLMTDEFISCSVKVDYDELHQLSNHLYTIIYLKTTNNITLSIKEEMVLYTLMNTLRNSFFVEFPSQLTFYMLKKSTVMSVSKLRKASTTLDIFKDKDVFLDVIRYSKTIGAFKFKRVANFIVNRGRTRDKNRRSIKYI